MNSTKLLVKTGNQQYPIFIGNNILSKIAGLLKKNLINFNQCLLVVDQNVPKKLLNRILSYLPKKKNYHSLFRG
tara:strand:+ start:107 stop:328 length:222 start_codon:yes stop_codon:yes gene_type:complete